MRRVSAPHDPRDPSNSPEISAAADRARERLREEFEQLRAGIEEMRAKQSSGDGGPSLFGDGLQGRVLASLAVLMLTAAVALAIVNFTFHQGRSLKDGIVRVPPKPHDPQPGVKITPDGGPAEARPPLLSLVAPGLQKGIFGPDVGLVPNAAPDTAPSSALFVVSNSLPVSGNGSPGQDVAGAGPVHEAPTPTAPEPSPEAPPQFAYLPPDDDRGDDDDGSDDHGGGGDDSDDDRGGGKRMGYGKGHIKARGKGHGGSEGRGHDRDVDSDEDSDDDYDSDQDSDDDRGGVKSRGYSEEDPDDAYDRDEDWDDDHDSDEDWDDDHGGKGKGKGHDNDEDSDDD
jgi:hypothetical protein